MANLEVLKEVEKKLARRYQAVQVSYTHQTIGTAVHGLIEAIQTTPTLKQVAERIYAIEEGPTVEEWEKTARGGWLAPPVERNKKARLGYELLSKLYENIGETGRDFIMGICHIGNRISQESKFDDSAREFVENFVSPLVAFMDEELEALIADEEVKDEDVSEPNPEKANRVFVVHGRDMVTLSSVLDYLNETGFEPLTFEEARMLLDTASPNLLQVVDKGMKESGAVVVLITPDDVGRLREETDEELKARPRENVVFEAGIAFGRYRDRTVLVELDVPSIFSDLHGYFVVRLTKGKDGIEGLEKVVQQVRLAVSKLKKKSG